MKKMNLIILLFTLFLSGCNKENTRVLDIDGINKELLLELVNQYRVKGHKCGSEYYPPVKPVKWNDVLESAAQKHSNDMASNTFFSHKGSDGSDTGSRLNSIGYDWITYGENIAKGHKTEKDVISAWMKSPGHCANIMSPNFREMGIALKNGYWTQVFATANPANNK